MAFLSASDLADFRQLAESAMSETARIQSGAKVRQPGGTTATVWTTVTTCPCSAITAQNADALGAHDERLRSAQEWGRRGWVVSVPVGTPVDTTQRIIVDGVSFGETWRKVLSVVGASGAQSFEAERAISCVEAELEPGEVIE